MSYLNAYLTGNILLAAEKFAKEAQAVDVAKRELDFAYFDWKLKNNVQDFVERGSVTWKAMLLGTEVYYRALQNAKSRERRARQKLIKAIKG